MKIKQIIEDSFKKAGLKQDDRTKYLFQILQDKIHEAFEKEKPKIIENYLSNMVLDGYSLEYCNGYQIKNSAEILGYFGSKDFVAIEHMRGQRAFSTIKGAMDYVENQE